MCVSLDWDMDGVGAGGHLYESLRISCGRVSLGPPGMQEGRGGISLAGKGITKLGLFGRKIART